MNSFISQKLTRSKKFLKKINPIAELSSIVLSPIDRKYYQRNCLEVAKDLLGKILVVKNSNKIISGIIVETEAYNGASDEASHSFAGITKRNKVMFEDGGHLYVYFTYGVHHCANVVTGFKNDGQAVLIRAIEPLSGIEFMSRNRFGCKLKNEKDLISLTNGPGKICQSFGITLLQNGIDLCDNKIFISDSNREQKFEICQTKRIGITKSKNLKWRFFIKGNRFVSRT